MNLKKILTVTAVAGTLLVGATAANATSDAQALFNARYLADDTACTTCHASASITSANTVGAAWLSNGGTKTTAPTDWTGFETAAGSTFGGVDPAWVDPATVVPTTTTSSSGGGCVTSSVATPLMMVLAMLSLGFFVRRKKS